MLHSKKQEIINTIIKHGFNVSDFEIIEIDLTDRSSSEDGVTIFAPTLKIDITYIPTSNSKSYMVGVINTFELELEQDFARGVYV